MSDIANYLQTRIFTARITVLWVLVTLAHVVGLGVASSAELFRSASLLALVLAHLRLWDDLADRTYDRVQHPERVLCNLVDVSQFTTLLLVGIAATYLIMGVSNRPGSFISYTALIVLLAILYHTHVGHFVSRAVRANLVLVKYPVMIVSVGGQPTFPRTWLVCFALYGSLVLFERYDDRRLAIETHRSRATIAFLLGLAIVASTLLAF